MDQQQLEREIGIALTGLYIHRKLIPESLQLRQATIDAIDRAKITRAMVLRRRMEP